MSYQTQAPVPVNAQSADSIQSQMYLAMMQQMTPEARANFQAAIALAQRKRANRNYMDSTVRKVSVALTNGAPTQAYTLGTPLTFNMSTSLNGYLEGLIFRLVVNYTLAAGTSAAYQLTAAGKTGIIDTIEVRYNKSQAKFRPFTLRQLSLLCALPQWVIQASGGSQTEVLVGQQDATLEAYANTTMPVTAGANTVTFEFFVPLNMVHPSDPRGLLPLMAGDTGIQVIVNTPQSLLAPTDTNGFGDPLINAIGPTTGTGHGISAISGTVQVEAVFRDGDTLSQLAKLPFDISLLEGTFQMQIDQQLTPWIAGGLQRTKLNIMGKHMYVILLCIDGNQCTALSARSNLAYVESGKDATGSNVFWRFGNQTNMSYYESELLLRLGRKQDLDPGVIAMVFAPVDQVGQNTSFVWEEQVMNYLDNTRTAWADWRFCVTPTATSSTNGANPRIEPQLFYVNPTGLVPV
jgi:hypothetical protein